MYYMGCIDAPTGRGTFGDVWPSEKHRKARDLGVVKDELFEKRVDRS